jgi:hypothetical protein
MTVRSLSRLRGRAGVGVPPHRKRMVLGRQFSSIAALFERVDLPPQAGEVQPHARPGLQSYFAFPARLSKNTPCSPNMFQNHHGRFSRKGRP